MEAVLSRRYPGWIAWPYFRMPRLGNYSVHIKAVHHLILDALITLYLIDIKQHLLFITDNTGVFSSPALRANRFNQP